VAAIGDEDISASIHSNAARTVEAAAKRDLRPTEVGCLR
jgi:hypothetical protein